MADTRCIEQIDGQVRGCVPSKERYQNPILGDRVKLRAYPHMSESFAVLPLITKVEVYKIAARVEDLEFNPRGSVLKTIVVNHMEGRIWNEIQPFPTGVTYPDYYYTYVQTDGSTWTEGQHEDHWYMIFDETVSLENWTAHESVKIKADPFVAVPGAFFTQEGGSLVLPRQRTLYVSPPNGRVATPNGIQLDPNYTDMQISDVIEGVETEGWPPHPYESLDVNQTTLFFRIGIGNITTWTERSGWIRCDTSDGVTWTCTLYVNGTSAISSAAMTTVDVGGVTKHKLVVDYSSDIGGVVIAEGWYVHQFAPGNPDTRRFIVINPLDCHVITANGIREAAANTAMTLGTVGEDLLTEGWPTPPVDLLDVNATTFVARLGIGTESSWSAMHSWLRGDYDGTTWSQTLFANGASPIANASISTKYMGGNVWKYYATIDYASPVVGDVYADVWYVDQWKINGIDYNQDIPNPWDDAWQRAQPNMRTIAKMSFELRGTVFYVSPRPGIYKFGFTPGNVRLQLGERSYISVRVTPTMNAPGVEQYYRQIIQMGDASYQIFREYSDGTLKSLVCGVVHYRELQDLFVYVDTNAWPFNQVGQYRIQYRLSWREMTALSNKIEFQIVES